MAQEKQLNTITEGKGAIPFSPKVNTSTVYDENGQPLNVVLRSVDSKFKECSHSIEEQREKTERLQDIVNEAVLHNGGVQAAASVNIASGTGLTAVNAQQAFAEIAREIYPVQVAIVSSNAGTYEVGDTQHAVTPQIVLSITRNGADVSSSAQTTSSQGEVQSDNRTIIGSALVSGTTTFRISITQGGQTKDVPNQVFSFTNYRYKGVLSSKPNTSNIVAAIRALPKELSTVSTLGQTTLDANKYYLFAVKGTVNLIVKNAKSGGTIDIPASDKGTATVPQENGVGSNTYSWVIVPASSNTWYFQITNY